MLYCDKNFNIWGVLLDRNIWNFLSIGLGTHLLSSTIQGILVKYELKHVK